jgi:hypothetical protein
VALALIAVLAKAGSSQTPTLGAAASPPRLVVESDHGRFRIGEPVRLNLEVVAPAGVGVELPGPGSALGPFELLDHRILPPDTLAEGAIRHAAQLTVTTYELGSATLPPLPALLRAPDGSVRAIHSDSLTLGVESVLPAAGADTADIRPLKAAVELPGRRRWGWLVAALLALLLAVAVILIVRRRHRRAPVIQAAIQDSRPADVIALEALAVLKREELARAGRVKEHYIRLTDIVRPYLERRFGVPALDLTTGEILLAMARAGGETTAMLELKRLLEEADLVKFARLAPPAALAEGAVDRAGDFVRATALRFVAPALSPPASPPSPGAPPAPGPPSSPGPPPGSAPRTPAELMR